MNKEFIPYEQALELKELGFDEPCFAFWSDIEDNKYTGNYTIRIGLESIENKIQGIRYKGFLSASTFSQAFRWFRKNHGLYSSILPKKSYPDNYVSGVEWYVIICGGDGVEIGPDGTYTYEEAELECLKKLMEIVGTIELPQHPSVISENGNELLFDKEGNLIKELPKQDVDKLGNEDVSKLGYDAKMTPAEQLKSIADKLETKKLITDIMNEDAKDGLYDVREVVEDDVEKLELDYYKELEERREVAKNFQGQVAGRHPDMFGNSEMHHMVRGYVEGYNKAKETLYTEEQVRDIVLKFAEESTFLRQGIAIKWVKDYFKSLKQPKQ